MAQRQRGNGNGSGGGTGAGGSGEGGGDGGGSGESLFNDDEKAAIEGMVNTAVNGALTNHLARFKKQFGEEIGKTLSDTLAPLGEQLKAIAAGQQGGGGQAGGSGDSAGGKGGKGLPPEVQEAMARMEGRTKELEGQLTQERKAREEEKAARERDRQEALAKEERQSLAAALRARGVPEPQIKGAVAYLAGEEKKLGRGEDGSIIFKINKGSGQAAYVDEVPLEGGVDEWLKTDEGKAYLPARPVGGAGALGARPISTGNRQQDARAEATQTLAKNLLGIG